MDRVFSDDDAEPARWRTRNGRGGSFTIQREVCPIRGVLWPTPNTLPTLGIDPGAQVHAWANVHCGLANFERRETSGPVFWVTSWGRGAVGTIGAICGTGEREIVAIESMRHGRVFPGKSVGPLLDTRFAEGELFERYVPGVIRVAPAEWRTFLTGSRVEGGQDEAVLLALRDMVDLTPILSGPKGMVEHVTDAIGIAIFSICKVRGWEAAPISKEGVWRVEDAINRSLDARKAKAAKTRAARKAAKT